MPELTPDSAAVVQAIAEAAGDSHAEPSLAQRRAALAAMAVMFGPEPAPVARIDDHLIEEDGREVPVRIYWPIDGDSACRVLLHVHGGGWALGGPDVYARQVRALCDAARCVVVDVDYRLAPENPYPAALDDCAAAARWTLDFAAENGLSGDRLAIIGDSAGGYLAAVLCQKFPEWFDKQILVYPVLTVGRENDCPSRRALGGGDYFLTFDAIINAEREFFSCDLLLDEANALSPLLATDDVIANLPPTLVVVAGADPLIDEGKAYAERQVGCGVDVTLMCESGTIHGCLLFSGAVVGGQKALQEIATFVRRT